MISWILGPSSRFNTGVAIYSHELIKWMQKNHDQSIEILKFPDNGKPNSFSRYVWQFIFLPVFILFRRNKNDLVIYQEAFIFVALFRVLTKRKTITVIHHVPEARDVSLKGKYLKLLFRLLPKGKESFVFVVPTQFTKNSLIERYGIASNKISVVYNIIEKNKLSDEDNPMLTVEKELEAACEISRYKKQNFIIISNVGSFEDRKNVSILPPALVELIKNSPDKKFLLVKVGLVVDELKKETFINLCAEHNIRLVFLESVTTEMIGYVYKVTDIYVAPSRYEGFGRTVIEAQMNGCIVCASNIKAHEEVLSKSAFLVNEFNTPSAWSSKLQEICNTNSERHNELLSDSLENAKRFSADNVIKEFIKLL